MKHTWTRQRSIWMAALLVGSAGIAVGFYRAAVVKVGRQDDGTFVVATGQRIEPGTIAFAGRPTDLAMHPDGRYVAVLNRRSVFLVTRDGMVPDSDVNLVAGGDGA